MIDKSRRSYPNVVVNLLAFDPAIAPAVAGVKLLVHPSHALVVGLWRHVLLLKKMSLLVFISHIRP